MSKLNKDSKTGKMIKLLSAVAVLLTAAVIFNIFSMARVIDNMHRMDTYGAGKYIGGKTVRYCSDCEKVHRADKIGCLTKDKDGGYVFPGKCEKNRCVLTTPRTGFAGGFRTMISGGVYRCASKGGSVRAARRR